MAREKILLLQNGRSVKVLTTDVSETGPSKMEIDVLIKEPNEIHYRPPIDISHPKYWKLKSMDRQKSRLLQLEYSGLSEKQIRKIRRELLKETS